jgi:membrane associated rhomboid family serine protease
MSIGSVIKKIYFNSDKLTDRDFRKSRTLFIFENGTAGIINSLTTAAFLAGYANYLGASDQFIGVIAAIPALTGAVQLLSPFVFENISRRKPVICFVAFIFRIILCLMAFIPFIFKTEISRLTALFVM